MKSGEIRQRFLDFFKKRGHKIIPSASLVPENDPSVLFTTAGMQPLVPYLLGEVHPKGKRLVNVQKCLRTVDIEDIGDKTHATFFEMLGNWSLGEYFKEEAIEWSFELLTSKEEGFGLDPKRIYITVFEGDENAPRDMESVEIWKKIGIPENRIYFRGEDNWWSPGENGPCGPSSEMFYDLTEEGLGDLSPEKFQKADDEQKVVEIWNDVFMEYEKKDGQVIGKLAQKNVDTGAGLDRLALVLQNKSGIHETDLFKDIMNESRKVSEDEISARIIADHFKASVFMISDGVVPENTDRGYVLRRLLRRAIIKTKERKLNSEDISSLVNSVLNVYGDFYKELLENKESIKRVIENELEKFEKTLNEGLRQFEKIIEKGQVSGQDSFLLFSTYGFPFELTKEIALKRNVDVSREEFEKELKQHQEKSKTASEGKFKGGLSGHGEIEKKYHTATHLLNAALRKILGDHVEQKGSNITEKRLRFDFSHSQKLTDEEKEKIEKFVNDAILKDLPISYSEMGTEKAKEIGAIGVFGHKYDDIVRVYKIGEDEPVSLEICGGPHVSKTGELGRFKIIKEEASSAGVRRIKAILE